MNVHEWISPSIVMIVVQSFSLTAPFLGFHCFSAVFRRFCRAVSAMGDIDDMLTSLEAEHKSTAPTSTAAPGAGAKQEEVN